MSGEYEMKGKVLLAIELLEKEDYEATLEHITWRVENLTLTENTAAERLANILRGNDE